ncbi:MAG TPA: M20/M25/M40 family metallo-hydrolase [bacterium]|nr:M20/M25/M40 family metallo-hydrolase [bacterium]
MAHPPDAPVNPRLVTELLETLVGIPSVNPTLVPGGGGEGDVARHLAAVCRRLGLTVAVEEVAPGRPNVIAVLSGTGRPGGRSLLLNGHTDTVGAAGMDAPFAPVLRGDRLYGRGADDMKSGLAAMVGAVAAVLDAGRRPRGDVLLTFAVDEEDASIGTAALARRCRADAAIVTESTGLRICLAHKGFAWARIKVEGRAAHGSDHATGVDAIVRMGRVLGALERVDREVLPRRSHPLLGRPSLHASVIAGGEGPSTYPPSCDLVLERRMLPDETPDGVRGELEGVLGTLRAEDPEFRASVEITLSRPGLEMSREAPIVRALHAAVKRHVGEPGYIGQSPWYDAALLAAAGIPTVIFGPSGTGAHAAVEFVDVPSVVRCAEVLAQVIINFCGADPA